jgi:RNA polymerase sigma factor (TIGR02999 family)
MTDQAASPDVPALLDAWRQGNRDALDQLVPMVYDELRDLADRFLRGERHSHTLQPTALAHEAFLRLLGQNASWQSRAHLFGVAAELMRRILVDHARRKHADKRGGPLPTMQLDERIDFGGEDLDLIALDDALQELERIDARQSRLIELRFFTGLSMEETAEALGISLSTAKREWRSARAWLSHELARS